ncbi:hypothetical protein AcW1_002147 [Taiwanofungus camphoratus]|nr:hypothetical protein AcW1_002147 [Antrodia cinnamomea]
MTSQDINPLPKAPFRFPLPDHDMYKSNDTVTPVPEDTDKIQTYIQDRRVIGYDPLVQPALLRHEVVSSSESQNTIASARFAAARILAGQDDRVLVIVGPCSIHSPEQALEYARLLKSKIPTWSNLHIIMRAYFEVRSNLRQIALVELKLYYF